MLLHEGTSAIWGLARWPLSECPRCDPGCMQASVGMGELGISLGDPDDWALDVLGDILNSFGGRLFDRIRSREVCTPYWEDSRWYSK